MQAKDYLPSWRQNNLKLNKNSPPNIIFKKVNFSYIGHVDIEKKARFTGSKPALYWGISQVNGSFELTKGARASFISYSPLVGTNPNIGTILAQNYSKANVTNGKFGGVEDFLPVDFSN